MGVNIQLGDHDDSPILTGQPAVDDGPSARHGPHHAAQKSTSTRSGLCNTSLARLAKLNRKQGLCLFVDTASRRRLTQTGTARSRTYQGARGGSSLIRVVDPDGHTGATADPFTIADWTGASHGRTSQPWHPRPDRSLQTAGPGGRGRLPKRMDCTPGGRGWATQVQAGSRGSRTDRAAVAISRKAARLAEALPMTISP